MRRKGPRYPNLPQGHLRRPARHSYHEGSTPESYILTALLIHSLKHKPGSKCPDSNCPLPPPGHPKGTAGPGKGAGGVDGGAEGGYVRSVSESEEGEAEKCMRPKIMLSLEDYDMSPLSSPSSAFQFAQISPLPSPHSAMTHASSSTSSLLPGPSSSSLSSSYRTESETTRPPDSDTSSFYDVSSLTDVTFDSSVMSLNAETLSLSSATLVDASFPSESRETYSELESSTFPKGFTNASISASVHSLPSCLTFPDPTVTSYSSLLPSSSFSSSSSTLRPVFLSGSLVLLTRRPSLVSPPPSSSSFSAQGHFLWEENPCYVRLEGGRPGEGHDFRPRTLDRPAWCDACAHLVFYHATTCNNCSYTCHEQCQELVALDCKLDISPDSTLNTLDSSLDLFDCQEEEEEEVEEVVEEVEEVQEEEEKEFVCEEVEEEEEEEVEGSEEEEEEEVKEEEEEEKKEEGLKVDTLKKEVDVSTLRRTVTRLRSHLVDNETLEAWAQKFSASTQGLQIAKEADGSFRGCVRVHLNLSRPINIVAGTRPPSIYDILQEDRSVEKTLTSFYMPRDAVKAIHITSKTTTREVIIALLGKFKVVDNPQKFALYEKTCDLPQGGKGKLHRLADTDCPLVLALNWSTGGQINKRLVLQENDTADIQWEAFSLPELSNFLRILDREEEEYRCQIQDKYSLLRLRIREMLLRCHQEGRA